MENMITNALFYFFSTLALLSAVMIITSRNPVYSVLFLIFAFFNAAGLFVLLGAEYLAMTLIVVYVGAVAVLFLFVVMMLDIDFVKLKQGFAKNALLGSGFGLLFFGQIFAVIYAATSRPIANIAKAANPIVNPAQVSNTKAIGNILYTTYAYPFQIAGLILLVGMIGAIVLTLRHSKNVRRQVIATQVGRKPSDSIELVNVTSGSGI